VLNDLKAHKSQSYTVLKRIMINNLYGVDIMEEAVEICKLRLFLKLTAQISELGQLEPLPDIDFNIRAGNTLVGYARLKDAEKSGRLDIDGTQAALTGRLKTLAKAAARYREQQANYGAAYADKVALTQELAATAQVLDLRLADEYKIDVNNPTALAAWKQSHEPFHWCSEFYTIVEERGGFDVIVGNPPYVEYFEKAFNYKILQPYTTKVTFNLYPMVFERCSKILLRSGRHSFVIPLAGFATKGMTSFIQAFQNSFNETWVSFFHFRPAMLFSGGKAANIATAVYIGVNGLREKRHATGQLKWNHEMRDGLFNSIDYSTYIDLYDISNPHYYPKVANPIETSIMSKIQKHQLVNSYVIKTDTSNCMQYRSAGGLYWKLFINYPWPYETTSNKTVSFRSDIQRDVLVALFNSSIFWFYYVATFDTFNLKDYMLFGFRFNYPKNQELIAQLCEKCKTLMIDYQKNAKHLMRGSTGSYTVYAKKSKHIIDEIDRVLARHYGFTDEELDYIINYDIKYRMGLVGGAGDDAEE
jgi:hypothetical protein